MKSLRKKFVTHIVIIFLIVLILMLFVFAFQMHGFFSNTVTDLDVMENKLLAEDVNTRIMKYQSAAESLAQNANLADMLAICATPEAFNSDHNFDLVSESMERARATIADQNYPVWAYSIDHQYQVSTGGRAKSVSLSDVELEQIDVLRENLRSTLFIEYVAKDSGPMFNIVTPVLRNGALCGLVGTSLDISSLLRTIGQKSGMNNMITECSLIVPTLNNDFSVSGYHEFFLKDGALLQNDLPVDFMSAYTNGVSPGSDHSRGLDGKEYLSELGSNGWYLASFVPAATVNSAFFSSFLSFGMGGYLLIMLVVLAGVWFIAYKLTQPIHDLGALVTNLRGGSSYAPLKGNNEITQAANSLIAFAEDNASLLDEIKALARKIEYGELFTRFGGLQNQEERHEIKLTFNQMLDSITRILDALPVGIAIINEDHTLIYLNKAIRQMLGVRAQDIECGYSVEDLERVNRRGKDIIVSEIERCKETGGNESKIYVMDRHISFVTTNFEYSQSEDRKALFLQVYLDQTELIGKIQEQEQIFAYFEHLSLVKKEALERLAKGDFKRASIEIGERPSVPYLQAIYDDQLEMKQAFQDTVDNIETIITRMGEATRAFAGGNLHSVIDAENAKGKYAELVSTANNAFDVILNYFQAIPVPIRIIGADYKVKFFNQAAYASGFRPGEDVRCYHLYNSDRPCETCPHKTGVKEISIREYVCTKGETNGYWKSYRNPLLDENGKIASMLEIRIDETEIVALKKAADSANMAKSTFIANMSHEIRTPMNAILGYSQLLEFSKSLNRNEREYVETIKRSGNHLLNLINDILEMSKIEAGKITINEQAFDLTLLFDDARGMFAPQMDAKGLSFNAHIAPDFASHVTGDVGKVRQIIFNVISNAIKFTDSGEIALFAKTEDAADGKVRVTIDIQDTGIGIAKEEWGRVFEAFEQADPENKSGAGTGLGMAISRNFSRMMGGDLTVLRSEPGCGTTFRIELSLKKETADNTQKEAAGKVYDRVTGIVGECTVLIADPSEDSRAILRQLLSPLGFTVLEAGSGEEAFKLWNTQTPDLIISDASTQSENLALLRRIRSGEKNMHTPVIVLTADALDQNKEAALSAGADAFMTKPFVLELLLREIGKLTGIEYLFNEAAAAPISQNDREEHLPEAAKEKIHAAVLRGDFDAVIETAQTIAGEFPATAARLIEYADDFNRDAILELLEQSGPKSQTT